MIRHRVKKSEERRLGGVVIGLAILCMSWFAAGAANLDLPGKARRCHLGFHHLQSCIELMAAGGAADAVRFDRELVAANPHAAAIRAAGEMDTLIIDGFVS